uniref:Cilia-and flagella-associated protein 96 n=1 Tax=Leptobrachium leishanense TaxID=445787 RepID=A0A8C5PWV8_9ANUR
MPGNEKSDMERIGLFSEPGYVSIGDKYVPPGSKPFNESAGKKRQIIPGCSSSDGYFDNRYNRIFEGEAYSEPVKERRKFQIQQAKKNLGKAFYPSNGEKKPSGQGSCYGTLSGPIPALNPIQKKQKTYNAPGKNIYTNPMKLGSGYGYNKVTIGEDYPYSSEKYNVSQELEKKEREIGKKNLKGGPFVVTTHPKDYFSDNPYRVEKPLPPLKKKQAKKNSIKPFVYSSPAKNPGGMKAGTFSVYPSHSKEPYEPKSVRKKIDANRLKPFTPPSGIKSYPVQSISVSNVVKSVNTTNYRKLKIQEFNIQNCKKIPTKPEDYKNSCKM